MNGEVEYIQVPVDWERCEHGRIDAERLTEEICRASKTAQELGVPMILDVANHWMIVEPDGNVTILPKEQRST